jgi:hypothetical protein
LALLSSAAPEGRRMTTSIYCQQNQQSSVVIHKIYKDVWICFLAKRAEERIINIGQKRKIAPSKISPATEVKKDHLGTTFLVDAW